MPARAAIKEYWVYKSTNLLVDKNVADMKALLQRCKACGVTHMLLTDSKFSRLAEMDARYFKNAAEVRAAAKEAGIAIVPAVCPIGYSNDLLCRDPNLIEALPVKDMPMVVKNGTASLTAGPVAGLKGGDMSDLKLWGWKDENIQSKDGTAYVKDPAGNNARLTQKVKLEPWRQYHLSVRVKTNAFSGTPEVKFLTKDGRALNYDSLQVKKTQDWGVHHVVFNSQENTEATLFLGCWDGKSGELWWDDALLEESAFVNLVRRDGTPLTVRTEGRVLEEGKDFERLTDPLMGTKPYAGCYTVWHQPPVLKTSLPDGTRLLVNWHHAATVHDDQAGICPSEKKTVEILRDQVQGVNKLWEPSGFMMSHDEIRVWNQCAACRARNLSAGQLLADNVRTCTQIIKAVNPSARIYVWSDMFDPNHNAKNHYYLARGDFAGAWEGLDKDVSIVPWYFEKRAESLKFFADRGHRQVIAGYYDSKPAKVKEWIKAAAPFDGVEAVMYTTWQNNYSDMETFFKIAQGKE
ncbi:MAG TPA: hypothetical protein VG796_23155 [Verrucomicrobiales bacterium]|nr:hypothetical protein [Verrucomicrobiales bacterium]